MSAEGSAFFDDPVRAVDELVSLYDAAVSDLLTSYREACDRVAAGGGMPEHVRRCYPEIRYTLGALGEVDPSLSHGFLDRPGEYGTTVARPALYRPYLEEQIWNILANHGGEVEIRVSDCPIPILLVPGYNDVDTSELTPVQLGMVEQAFDPVDSALIDDAVADGEADFLSLSVKPLSLFSAPRVDLALERLEHYTGSSASYIQKFVLFTNYQLHTDVFLEYAHQLGRSDDPDVDPAVAAKGGESVRDLFAEPDLGEQPYEFLVAPGNNIYPVGVVPTDREVRADASACQMPAYHLVREGGLGVTIIDIGVGASNAKTITDCLAVIRPHCWIMVGHCAGLDGRMEIGDMILGNGYDRSDGVLDRMVPLAKPIPPIAEVQRALEEAFADVSGLEGEALRRRFRTGTVHSTADRNWEWQPQSEIYRELQKSTAIAVEMESATIATNGYRFRVPYGVLLSVSDKPLHNRPKLPGDAQRFYQASKVEHLMTAVRACEAMSASPSGLHSRKLRRPVGEVAFR